MAAAEAQQVGVFPTPGHSAGCTGCGSFLPVVLFSACAARRLLPLCVACSNSAVPPTLPALPAPQQPVQRASSLQHAPSLAWDLHTSPEFLMQLPPGSPASLSRSSSLEGERMCGGAPGFGGRMREVHVLSRTHWVHCSSMLPSSCGFQCCPLSCHLPALPCQETARACRRRVL